MSAELTEARVREIMREEITAVVTYLIGGRLDPETGKLVPVKQPPEGYDFFLQRHETAEQSVKPGLERNQSVGATSSFDPDAVDDSLSDRQPLGDVVEERDEFHASPSFTADTESVGDDPAPGDGLAGPGADGQGASA